MTHRLDWTDINSRQKQVRRLCHRRGNATVDLLSLHDEDPRAMERIILHHPADHKQARSLTQDDLSVIEPLLVEVLREGALAGDRPSIEEMRAVRATWNGSTQESSG
jgi:hypothetical protein